MSEFFFGIDLGGTNVVMGLLDEEGEIKARRIAPTLVMEGPQSLVRRIAMCGRDLMAEAQVSSSAVKGVGIGTPGPISIAQGKIITSCNLPGFDDFCLRGACSELLGIPAALDNDANAACWGEFWRGAGEDISDMVMFTLGTGIGGGIVCRGELVHGFGDNAGELGHIILAPDGRLCNCGQRGCFEAYSSANQTALRAEEELDKGRASSLREIRKQKGGQLTSKEVFDEAKAGDGLALEVVDGTAKYIALASINMNHITEPKKVVLAGGMIQAGEILLSKVRQFYDALMWRADLEPMEICYARLGGDAGMIGAAGIALHAYRQDRLASVGI